jgi:cell wall-associated NlpC family hydrolase
MRFGLPLHLAVLVLLAFPAAGAAASDPLSSTPESHPLNTFRTEELALVSAGQKTAQLQLLPVYTRGQRVVSIALRYLGVPYRWGGASPSGFDCSGLVMFVYRKVGVALPHNSTQMWGRGRRVARSQLSPGDVVFFNGLSHVGIFIGNGRFVHAPHSGEVVKISRLSDSWYRSTYDGARRYW